MLINSEVSMHAHIFTGLIYILFMNTLIHSLSLSPLSFHPFPSHFLLFHLPTSYLCLQFPFISFPNFPSFSILHCLMPSSFLPQLILTSSPTSLFFPFSISFLFFSLLFFYFLLTSSHFLFYHFLSSPLTQHSPMRVWNCWHPSQARL